MTPTGYSIPYPLALWCQDEIGHWNFYLMLSSQRKSKTIKQKQVKEREKVVREE